MGFLARVAYLDLIPDWFHPGQAAYAVVTYRIPQFIQQKSFYSTYFTLAPVMIISGSRQWIIPGSASRKMPEAFIPALSRFTTDLMGE